MLRKYQPKIIGLAGLTAILAVLAVGAFGASSASALPELLWCMTPAAAGTETYASEAECEKLENVGTNLAWAWEDETLSGEAFELMFTSGLGLMLAVASTVHIECETDVGGFTTVTLVGGVQLFSGGDVTFKGCISLNGPVACNAPGQAEGVILTKPLLGSLVYLKKTKTKPVGILLEPETGTIFVEIECGALKGTVEGSIIGEIAEPYNTEVATSSAIFAIEAGHQKWRKVEEEAAKFELKAFGELGASLETTDTLEVLVGGASLVTMIDA